MTALIRRGNDAEADTEQDSGAWRVGRTGSSLITVVLILIISLTQACTTRLVGDPNWRETLRTNPNALHIQIDETPFYPYVDPDLLAAEDMMSWGRPSVPCDSIPWRWCPIVDPIEYQRDPFVRRMVDQGYAVIDEREQQRRETEQLLYNQWQLWLRRAEDERRRYEMEQQHREIERLEQQRRYEIEQLEQQQWWQRLCRTSLC